MARVRFVGGDLALPSPGIGVALGIADCSRGLGPISFAAAVLCNCHLDVGLCLAVVAQRCSLVCGVDMVMGWVA